jgi:hypothetical protein
MQLWFYKAENGNWQDKLISWWTKGSYSHVEIVFSDGMAFSSSPRDGGCRFRKIEYSDHWEVISLDNRIKWLAAEYWSKHWQDIPDDIGPLQFAELYEDEIRKWCESQVGKTYDWKAILGWTFGECDFQDKEKWYCSEIAYYVLNLFGIKEGYHREHPSEMYAQIISESVSDGNKHHHLRSA